MRNVNDIETLMEAVLDRTTEIVNYAYQYHREFHANVPLREKEPTTRLVFPRFFHGKADKTTGWTRISEQELRFAFVQAFNEYVREHDCDYYYSVETPTESYYTFSKEENGKRKKIEPIIGKGQSGNLDLSIYDKCLNRICIIEFKSGYISPQAIKEVKAKLLNKKERGKERDALCFLVYMKKDKARDIQDVEDIISKKITLKVTI